MAQNKVMKLWTAFVTAFLALCTALGLITTSAAAAVPQTGTPRNSSTNATAPVLSPRSSPWSNVRSLPPTMKQRIRAEAHNKTPSCRHRSPVDPDAPSDTAPLEAGAQEAGAQDTALPNTATAQTTTQAQDTAQATTPTAQTTTQAQDTAQATTPNAAICAPAVPASELLAPLQR
ncbi:hypothetical protein M2271_002948 [Streptomyces sp. LBL]|uniref:DUF6344 domain-containing protein n=1 Tax=Streptomyces sp. LBL TaxID=2940562 RepID=UPI0024767D30|nr:DUF6344 domain-containing protein [Streptomyces sp. LBL]MDH6625144.1 hypothetical protein [Streptomyces sp. LBL]